MTLINLSKDAFNTKQASQVVGASIRQVIHWDKVGLVKPSIRSASGRGSGRLFSYVDLLALKTVESLREDGISLQKIQKCVRYIRKHLPDVRQPLGFCKLIAVGQTIYMARDRQTLIDTIKLPGQHAHLSLIVDISGIDRELRAVIHKFVSKRVEEVALGDYLYQVEIEPDLEDGGYVAEVAGLPGCLTQGDTLEETIENAKDAIETYLEALDDMRKEGMPVTVNLSARRRRKASA